MKREIHLTGAHSSALDLEGSTDSLEEVTCAACRDFARRVGGAYASARRNKSIAWVEEEHGSARVEAFRVLEEQIGGPAGHEKFRRFDLKKWLGAAPGVYPTLLRVRAGGGR